MVLTITGGGIRRSAAAVSAVPQSILPLKKHPVLLTRLVFGAVMLDYEQKEF
jgi:hypothetical protein